MKLICFCHFIHSKKYNVYNRSYIWISYSTLRKKRSTDHDLKKCMQFVYRMQINCKIIRNKHIQAGLYILKNSQQIVYTAKQLDFMGGKTRIIQLFTCIVMMMNRGFISANCVALHAHSCSWYVSTCCDFPCVFRQLTWDRTHCLCGLIKSSKTIHVISGYTNKLDLTCRQQVK